MGKKTVLGILGGIVAAAALGVALSMVVPGFFASEGTPSAIQGLFPNNAGASGTSALANERSAPVFYPVTMPISQADFDDSATRIPVQVEGTTTSGEAYSKLHFVDGAGFGIKLVSGDYRMNIPAGYITGEGKLYLAPGDEVQVRIAEDLEEGTAVQATIYVPQEQRNDNYVSDEIRERVEALTPKPIEMLYFTEVPLMEITEEQLDEVVSLAKQDANDEGRAEEARSTIEQMQKDTRRAQEKAEREAAIEAEQAEQRRLAEEQAAAARAEAQAAIDAAKRQAEEEARQKKAEEEEAIKQVAKAIEGWWIAADSGLYYHLNSNNTFEMYDVETVSQLTKGSMTITRLTDEQAERAGTAGYLVSFGGPQCFLLPDGTSGLMECRHTADLSRVGSGDLTPTTEPDKSASSSSAAGAQDQQTVPADDASGQAASAAQDAAAPAGNGAAEDASDSAVAPAASSAA